MPGPDIDASTAITPGNGPLLIDRPDHGVVLLSLNVPKRRNAMSAELTQPGMQRSRNCGMIARFALP
ncbi:MAG: hypothetical protein M3446_03065 [Actinomycetota bacterium]|nr:hypothetical protein [Actinomycetota bacterium]